MSVAELQKLISPKFDELALIDIFSKKYGWSEIKIKNIEIADPASSAGDSYLSKIFRFSVDATGKNGKSKEETANLRVIVKAFPANIARRKTYRSADFFENEYIFYNTTWKALDDFQKSKGVTVFDNIPTVLSSYCDGSYDYLAMEDISPLGFRSAPRSDGLDFEHTSAILKMLASFHGLSLAFKDQQPKSFEQAASALKETYFAEKFRKWYSGFQETLHNVVQDAIGKELPPVYFKKFEELYQTDIYGRACQSCVDHGPLSVICQGDVWVPNFLLQYEGENPQKIVLIDFQLARWTSLATDLSFFLYTCVQTSVLEKEWDNFIEFYYKALQQTLIALGSSETLFSLDRLKQEIAKYIIFGIAMSMEAVPFSLIENDEVSDLDAIKGEDAVPIETVWTLHPFKDQQKRKRIASFIKFSVDKGFI